MAVRLGALGLIVAPILAACADNSGPHVQRAAFTSKEFGVNVSPRVSTAKYPPHGGGRYLALKPYTVRNVVYQPVDGPGYSERGSASWYGLDFHGRRTANGEIFGAYYLTGASPTLPIPCYARVTNLENGRSVLVRFNDRGPYMQGRIADLSLEAATVLGYASQGSAQVQVTYVGPAPLNVDDSRMLMASVGRESGIEQGTTRVAMLETPPSRASAVAVSAPRPASRDVFSGGLIGDIINSLSYADAEQQDRQINAAVDAATAMSTRATALEDWVAVTDDDARKIKLQLGVFSSHDNAVNISEAFAMLGAVDEDAVRIGDHAATRLTLTHLKPGVGRADVISLARQLGLNDIVLY